MKTDDDRDETEHGRQRPELTAAHPDRVVAERLPQDGLRGGAEVASAFCQS